MLLGAVTGSSGSQAMAWAPSSKCWAHFLAREIPGVNNVQEEEIVPFKLCAQDTTAAWGGKSRNKTHAGGNGVL